MYGNLRGSISAQKVKTKSFKDNALFSKTFRSLTHEEGVNI